MRVVNERDVEELHWTSPGGRFDGFGKQISEALGRERDSTDLMKRHPFDVELARIPAGATPCPYHSHSAQWEFYYVLSGRGRVRCAEGTAEIEAGDSFLFKPGEPHQLTADAATELLLIVVADIRSANRATIPIAISGPSDRPNGASSVRNRSITSTAKSSLGSE